MTRKLLAVLCALVLCISLLPSAGALSGEERRAADRLRALGMMEGTTALQLNDAATRKQAADILAELGEFADETSADAETPVTANEFFALLLHTLGYRAENGDFTADDAARFARRIGITTQDYTSGDFTLGDMCCIAADALFFRYKDSEDTVLQRLMDRGAVTYPQAAALGLLNPELTARQIYDRCSAAVFQLDCRRYDSENEPDDPTPDSTASGFFLDSTGIAVTNCHSIEYVTHAVAVLSTGEQYPVEKVLYVNKKTDIAILQISRTSLDGVETSAFAHLELPETDDVRAGDAAYAISCPLGVGLAISDGIVSDPSRPVDSYALPCILNTASISQGSSGGVLLNAYGEAIGITSGAYLYGNEMYLSVPLVPALETDLVFIETSLEVFFNDMPFLDLDK